LKYLSFNKQVLLKNKKYELLKNLKKGDILNNGDVIQCVVRSDCLHGKAKLVKITDEKFINNENVTDKPNIEGFEELYITPWHPIKSINGVWAFPNDIGTVEEMECDAVYSFLVLKSHTGTVNSSNTANDNVRSLSRYGSHGIKDSMMTDTITVKNEKEEHSYSSAVRINGIDCAALAHGIAGVSVISHPFYGTLNVERELRKCKGWEMGLVHFRPGPSPFLRECGRSPVRTEHTCSRNSTHDSDDDVLEEMHDSMPVAPYVLEEQYGTESLGCVLKDARTGLAKGFVLTLEV
jgi:hypothetical protein